MDFKCKFLLLIICVFYRGLMGMAPSLKEIENQSCNESCREALEVIDLKPYDALTTSIKKGNKAETQHLLNVISSAEGKTKSDVLGTCLIINYKNLDPLFIKNMENLGGNVNYQDTEGDNIFVYLAINNSDPDPEIIQSLINCGANPNITNNLGATALELAEFGNEKLSHLFKTLKKESYSQDYN